MNKRKDFADDLGALSESVDADVSRVVTLLKSDQGTPLGANPRNRRDPRRARPVADGSVGSSSSRHHASGQYQQRAPLSRRETFQNVTTRLPADINELLTEAALRQKLKKQPGIACSRQDIVIEALLDWDCATLFL